jgi:hypothetical protein
VNRIITGAAAALLALCTVSAADAASIEIRNKSSWDLHYLYVGPAGDPDWGPDQLGDQVILSGETFTLSRIACGRYDLQLIDEDGDACAIYDVALCDDKAWDITDKHLLTCQAVTE